TRTRGGGEGPVGAGYGGGYGSYPPTAQRLGDRGAQSCAAGSRHAAGAVPEELTDGFWPSVLVSRRLAVEFRRCALALAFETATLRALRRPSRTSGQRRRHGVTQKRRQSFSRSDAVLPLRALFAGAYREHRTREPCGEPVDRAGALQVAQCCGRTQIEAELHA